MQIGFYFDQTRCTGCSTCRVACKDWNDVPAGPENWMRVEYTEQGEFPTPFVSYRVEACWHCLDPVCIPACPAQVISKRESDGIVVVDSKACLGLLECDKKCQKACPYNAPQFGPEKDAKMGKCNLCLDRMENGQIPSCVESCSVRALEVGPLDELKEKYGDIQEMEGFKYSGRVKPAVVFKPKTK